MMQYMQTSKLAKHKLMHVYQSIVFYNIIYNTISLDFQGEK